MIGALLTAKSVALKLWRWRKPIAIAVLVAALAFCVHKYIDRGRDLKEARHDAETMEAQLVEEIARNEKIVEALERKARNDKERAEFAKVAGVALGKADASGGSAFAAAVTLLRERAATTTGLQNP